MQRRAKEWSREQAFEVVREGLHLGPKSRSAWNAIDMGGRQPKPDEAAYLASVFGWPPTLDPDNPVEEEPPADLTQALAGLSEELAALRRERVALWRGIAMALASPAGEHVAAALRDALAPLLLEVAPQ